MQGLIILRIEEHKGFILDNQHSFVKENASIALLEETHVEDRVRLTLPLLTEYVLHENFLIKLFRILHYYYNRILQQLKAKGGGLLKGISYLLLA
jgi:hypothetical protein